MKKLIIIIFIFISLFTSGQTLVPVCGQLNTFTGMTRGYHFTSPTDFTICGLYVEDDVSTLFQSVAIVRFTAGAPPAWAGTTNAFVTLFQNLNYAPNNMIAVPNVVINTGDIIGIYGSRGANSINSYGNPNCVLNIAGFPATAQRSGMQADLATGPSMANIWSEVNYNIGRVTMTINCIVLPVELIEFNGYNKGKINKLYWRTLSEINNEFFTLERSMNGIDWEIIGTVLGAGNSNEELYYEFNDDSYTDGLNYYRLTQTDFNGAHKTFETVTINTSSTIVWEKYKVINLLGQEVSIDYSGIRIIIFESGRTMIIPSGVRNPKIAR